MVEASTERQIRELNPVDVVKEQWHLARKAYGELIGQFGSRKGATEYMYSILHDSNKSVRTFPQYQVAVQTVLSENPEDIKAKSLLAVVVSVVTCAQASDAVRAILPQVVSRYDYYNAGEFARNFIGSIYKVDQIFEAMGGHTDENPFAIEQ